MKSSKGNTGKRLSDSFKISNIRKDFLLLKNTVYPCLTMFNTGPYNYLK